MTGEAMAKTDKPPRNYTKEEFINEVILKLGLPRDVTWDEFAEYLAGLMKRDAEEIANLRRRITSFNSLLAELERKFKKRGSRPIVENFDEHSLTKLDP
jgi:hypothetical protein